MTMSWAWGRRHRLLGRRRLTTRRLVPAGTRALVATHRHASLRRRPAQQSSSDIWAAPDRSKPSRAPSSAASNSAHGPSGSSVSAAEDGLLKWRTKARVLQRLVDRSFVRRVARRCVTVSGSAVKSSTAARPPAPAPLCEIDRRVTRFTERGAATHRLCSGSSGAGGLTPMGPERGGLASGRALDRHTSLTVTQRLATLRRTTVQPRRWRKRLLSAIEEAVSSRRERNCQTVREANSTPRYLVQREGFRAIGVLPRCRRRTCGRPPTQRSVRCVATARASAGTKSSRR